jgi:hypothetical protein
MRHLILSIVCLGSLLYVSACEKPPIYDSTPSITWASFSSDTVQQLSGVVDVTFNFTDGDGDLGRDGATEDHILLIDTRRTPNDTLRYKIPTIDQQGIVSGISGQITVTLAQLCGINPNNPLILCQPQPNYYDPVVYKIIIKDNAGRWSNEIFSDTLYIKCFD